MGEKKAHTFEERLIQCDGRLYRVTRTAGHVTILDARGNVLKKSPKDAYATTDSVFTPDESFWCDWIRPHRGEGQ